MQETIVWAGAFNTIIKLQDETLTKTFFMLSTIMSCFSYSVFILYVCLSQIASSGFKVIGRELKEQKPLLGSIGSAVAKERIKQWKQSYENVCAYVHQLNGCFGTILLFEICGIFLGFIISLFYLIQMIQGNEVSASYAFVIGACVKHLVSLVVICIVSENIKSQVLFS